MLYHAQCQLCHFENTFIAPVDKRDNEERLPVCPDCNVKMPRQFNAPMVAAMGHTSGSMSMVSPIDGTVIHGASEYKAHMKKHGVLPESELKGEAAYQKAEKQKAYKKKQKETLIRTVTQMTS